MASSSRSDAPAPARAAWRDAALAVLVAAAAAAGYVLLYAGIDIDDTALIAAPIAAGQAVWSPAHLLMNPAALALYRLAGTPPDVLLVLRLANTAAAALSLGLGFLLLRVLGAGRGMALAGAVAAWGSFALLQLATSGHVKLFALPFVVLGLLALAFLPGRGGAGRLGLMALAGAAWGLAAAFLASFALVGPVVAALVFLRALADRAWGRAGRAVGEYALLGAVMAVVLGGALAVGWQQSGAPGGDQAGGVAFLDWTLEDRERAETPGLSALDVARSAVGMVKTHVWLYRLPEGARAWLAGEGPGFGSVAGTLAEAKALLFALAWMGLAAVWAVLAWRRGQEGELALLGALAASVLFCLGWGYFEADFQFPVAFLAGLALFLHPPWERTGGRAAVLALGLALALYNVGAYALPRLAVDARATQAQLRALVGPADLMLCGCAFSGRDSAYHYWVPPQRQVRIVQHVLDGQRIRDAAGFYAALERRIAAALAGGGRVYLFDLLEPDEWGPPWPQLHALGVRKPELRRRLGAAFTISAPRAVGGLTYVELGAKP